MRFKYKPDCSIPNLPKRDRFILAGLSGETPLPARPPRREQTPLWWFELPGPSIVSICNTWTAKPALPVTDRDIVQGPNCNVSICNTKPASGAPDVTDRDLSLGQSAAPVQTTTKVPVPIVAVWTGWACVHRVVSKLRYHFWYISLRLREYNTRTLYVSAPPVRGRLAVTRTKGFILCAESSATPALILQRTSWSRASSVWSIAAMTPRASRSRWARAPRRTSTSSAAWARSRAWRASFPTSTVTLPAVSATPVGPPTASLRR